MMIGSSSRSLLRRNTHERYHARELSGDAARFCGGVMTDAIAWLSVLGAAVVFLAPFAVVYFIVTAFWKR
jgi:hypothetical protein